MVAKRAKANEWNNYYSIAKRLLYGHRYNAGEAIDSIQHSGLFILQILRKIKNQFLTFNIQS